MGGDGGGSKGPEGLLGLMAGGRRERERERKRKREKEKERERVSVCVGEREGLTLQR